MIDTNLCQDATEYKYLQRQTFFSSLLFFNFLTKTNAWTNSQTFKKKGESHSGQNVQIRQHCKYKFYSKKKCFHFIYVEEIKKSISVPSSEICPHKSYKYHILI